MNFEEYRKYDATGLAELVRKKQIKPEELLEIAVARTEAVNGKLNGVIHKLYDQARNQIKSGLEGPLAGVPMVVKDLYQEIAGAPHHKGNKALKKIQATAGEDSTLVKRWKAAGLVLFGRTNTPEFGAKGVTEPEAYGPSRNPWNTSHTPGGSSGGSAAMVAAGAVPAAGANDGGGSIRIPAACCGLFGLKPGRGRTPWGPAFTEAMHGMSVNHVLTRSVRDSALLLDATYGDETGSLYHLAPPSQPYAKAAASPPASLRIAYTTRSPLGTPVSGEAVKAVENTAALLAELGHTVEEGEPNMDGKQLLMDWLSIWFARCAATVKSVTEQTGCGTDGFETDTLAMAACGKAMNGEEYVTVHSRTQQYMIAFDRFLENYDLWMTPAMAEPPLKIGANEKPIWQNAGLKLALTFSAENLVVNSGLIEEAALQNLRSVPFTQMANVTGVPAMSVPLHRCASGLPLGIQLVGGHGGEELLLSLAGQLEEARPWFDIVPPI